MTHADFLNRLLAAKSPADVDGALVDFQASETVGITWTPVGERPNNVGTVDVSTDSGRSIVERVTNAIDAILELEHSRHGGKPECRSPREAAATWLAVPAEGLSEMSQLQRRQLAQRITVRMEDGTGPLERVVTVQDKGIGISKADLPRTILSLNESNKLSKFYLSGAYGQGGSSTFRFAKYTVIASIANGSNEVAFSLVKYEELPADQYKLGRYVYMKIGGAIPTCAACDGLPEAGTTIRHVGYELSTYSQTPPAPNSLYGLLNRALFDPILPIWLAYPKAKSTGVGEERRVIKGARNHLCGAIDDGDEKSKLAHHMPPFVVSLGDLGSISLEYWLLDRPEDVRKSKLPVASYVDPAKTIVLTLNGQTQSEFSRQVIRKDADLPFLVTRLIVHVDCNGLTPDSKRKMFASTREESTKGMIRSRIQSEVAKSLASDDELKRLNNEARDAGLKEQDEFISKEVRQEVSRLLGLQGYSISERSTTVSTIGTGEGGRPTKHGGGGGGARTPKPVPLNDPPSYVKLVWEADEPIVFHAGMRRYVRIETDAYSEYHDSKDPKKSRINVFSTCADLLVRGTTPLRGGRMRVLLDCAESAQLGAHGVLRVELSRMGMSVLTDERSTMIVEAPSTKQSTGNVTVPPFEFVEVTGPDDENWAQQEWPIEEIESIACSAQMNQGTLYIYYSAIFPRFAQVRGAFEKSDPSKALSFTRRYRIWLAVHSLMMQHEEERIVPTSRSEGQTEESHEAINHAHEMRERCRLATMAAMFAAREVNAKMDQAAD